jgi:hypothetical protein
MNDLQKITRSRQIFQPKKNTYTRLLTTLILLLFLSPLVEGRIGSLLTALIFLWANLFALETIYLPSSIIWSLRIIAGLGFACDIVEFPNNIQLNDFLSLITYCCYALFMMGAILIIGKRIFSEQKVNNDILRGGICLYLLIGILWFIFYGIIEFVASGSFNHSDNNNLEIKHKLMYFSFTTLTTLGYGDVTPAKSITMLLANAEAIIGQLYPAIFIARLVSLYSHEHNDE